MNETAKQLENARRRGVPIIALETPDQSATLATISRTYSTEKVVSWSLPAGFSRGEQFGIEPGATKGQLAKAYERIAELPEGACIVIQGAPRAIDAPAPLQAIHELRDVFAAHGKTLILMGNYWKLPEEIKHDVLLIQEELPTLEELETIAAELLDSAYESHTENPKAIAPLLRGLNHFAAEQSLALAMGAEGVCREKLWKRRKATIEATSGLSLIDNRGGFNAIGGCQGIKEELAEIIGGKRPPTAIVWVDEIEKQISGQNDSSGVSQDQLQMLLNQMQEESATGMIFLGPPGSAKSACAKAIGAEANIPTLALDLGAAKGGIVGESEAKIRAALKTIKTIAGDGALWIATANSLTSIPTSLQRRFNRGLWFFDIPTAEERAAIWEIYKERYEIDSVPDGLDNNWTGAEIEQAAASAWETNRTLEQVAGRIVPVATSDAEGLSKLRAYANGVLISATTGKAYTTNRPSVSADTTPRTRKLNLK